MDEQSIFTEALQRDAAEQLTFLDEVCGADRELRKRVEKLLHVYQQAGGFLEKPAAGPPDAHTPRLAEGPGSVIGHYRLVEQIGEGGFGTVFTAQQQGPVPRRVALKILKPGMDTEEVIARFDTERQALAMMDHPHVAKALDAGRTESGRPYFVMELINGPSLTEYCDGHRLPVPQRLRLFSAVCHAIDHAHRRGVIHRDIKPSNVLVTDHDGEPTPKVIDFGIAKATQRSLKDETAVTRTGQFVGTPQYMSPEQADMSPLEIGPRSDIYSLGAVLYELLTGATPFDTDQLLSAGLDQMRRIMREVDPPRPSVRLRRLGDTSAEVASNRDTQPQTLNRLVAGDLDWITLKALEKDPAARYATACELAEDIGRFLENRPILARRPTPVKRLAKWTQRHKAMAASGVFVLLVSVVLLALSNLYIRGARDQALRQKSETERQLWIATSMRLAAQSQSVRNQTPIQSLLLAVEATQVTRRRGQSVPLLARESLLEALSVIGGRPLLGRGVPVAVPGPAISASGRWMATISQDQVRLWDLTKPGNSQIVLRGQEATSVVWVVSSDGRWIVTSEPLHTSGNLQLWDLTAADPLTVLRGHTDWVSSVRMSPDGRWLATGSRDEKVRVWDLTADDPGAAVKFLCPDAPIAAPKGFSPDGRWLVTNSKQGAARLWDLAAEDPNEASILLPAKEHESGSRGAAFSANGRWLATGSSVYQADRSTAVKLWDLTAENPAADPIQLPGDAVEIEVVAFSPDGRWLVSAGLDGTAQLWDVTADDPARTQVVLRGHSWGIWDAAFSPDSRWLVTASSDKTARLWNLTAEDPSAVSMVLRGHETRVTKAAFTPDSQRVITWSTDGAARIWNIAPGMFGLATTEGLAEKTFPLPTTPQLLWQQPRVRQAWMIENGAAKFLTANLRGEATLWDLSSSDPWRSPIRLTASKVSGAESSFGLPVPSRDGRWVSHSGQEGTVLWDLRAKDLASSGKLLPGRQGKGRGIYRFSRYGRWLLYASYGSLKSPWSVPGRRFVFSPNERWLTTPNWDRPINLWDVLAEDSDPRPLILRGEHRDDPDRFRDLRVWDLEAPDPAATSLVLRGFEGDVIDVVFCPNNQWLGTVSEDGIIRLWDMQAHDPAAQPYVLHGPKATSNELAFSSDGKWLVSSTRSEDAPSVYLWDLSDREFPTKPFRVPGQILPRLIPRSLTPFSPDVRWLLTISREGPVRLWDLTAEDPSASPVVLRGHVGTPLATAFSPDGRWVATGGAANNKLLLRDETVRLWDLSNPDSGVDCVVLRGYASRCAAMTFTADSHHLVTRCKDGEVRVWELRLDKLVQLARRAAGRQLTPEEREKYLLPTKR